MAAQKINANLCLVDCFPRTHQGDNHMELIYLTLGEVWFRRVIYHKDLNNNKLTSTYQTSPRIKQITPAKSTYEIFVPPPGHLAEVLETKNKYPSLLKPNLY